MLHICLVFVFVIVSVASGAELPEDFQPDAAPGPYVDSKVSSAVSGVQVRSGRPLIATTYFYWYDEATKSHIIDHDGTDALTEHPPTTEGLSYKNVAWHRQQLTDMMAAGIDVAMPVYWGGPLTAFSWSDEGLPHLIEAREKLLAEGKSPPAIGMFYDTSTLHANRGNYHVDLTKPAGHRWFYATVRNFFSLIPPQHRVEIDGKPLVILYSHTFAKDVDDTLFPAVRKMFRRDFGRELYLVKQQGWPGESDSVYQWGAAFAPKLLATAAVGPGYDHAAVPGRHPLVRQREGGRFYEFAWELLLSKDPAARPWLVHVETWNEFHEGTEICETAEFGRQYIELTRRYADLFHAGTKLSSEQLRPGPAMVSATPEEARGAKVVDRHDGPVVVKQVDGQKAWSTQKNMPAGDNRYLYFDVHYSFLYEGDEPVRIVVEYFDDGPDGFRVEYDSSDPAVGDLEQMFRNGPIERLQGTSAWKKATFDLPHARFAGRANGCDFRLTCHGADLLVRRVEVTRQ